MTRLRQCVILLVTLLAMTGILTAAGPNPEELRQKGRELQMQDPRQTQSGVPAVREAIVQQMKVVERYIAGTSRSRNGQSG